MNLHAEHSNFPNHLPDPKHRIEHSQPAKCLLTRKQIDPEVTYQQQAVVATQ